MGSTYDVWFAIPSASVERCRRVLPAWRERGYKIAILQNQERGDVPADVVRWSDSYPGWAESINILCREVVPRSADIVVSGGCDMLPDPTHHAQELARQFFGKFPDGFGVMQPHGDKFMDAHHYCGSPFLGRRWIDTMYGGTGPMFGGYQHGWGDVELYWVSKCLGALWERPDLVHFHDHITRGHGTPVPFWYVSNVQRHDRRDLQLHLARRAAHFPGYAPKGHTAEFDPTPLREDSVRFAQRQFDLNYGEEFERQKWAMEEGVVQALRWCVRHGIASIALGFAWYDVPKLRDVLATTPVRIAYLVNDGQGAMGDRLWGFDVHPYPALERADVQAVLLAAPVAAAAQASLETFTQLGGVVVPCGQAALHASQKQWCARRALRWCRERGLRRVALYGAGRHTADLAPVFEHGDVKLVCIIDDQAQAGQAMLGVRVVSREAGLAMGLDAVVLSSDQHEKAMLEACEPLRRAGVVVVPMYLDKPVGAVRARSA